MESHTTCTPVYIPEPGSWPLSGALAGATAPRSQLPASLAPALPPPPPPTRPPPRTPLQLGPAPLQLGDEVEQLVAWRSPRGGGADRAAHEELEPGCCAGGRGPGDAGRGWMRVKAINRSEAACTRERAQDVRKVHTNLDPQLHPFERAVEYTRALNAAKLDRSPHPHGVCQAEDVFVKVTSQPCSDKLAQSSGVFQRYRCCGESSSSIESVLIA